MAEYQLPGRPEMMKEGTYRVAEEPIASFVWEEKDTKNHMHIRGEGVFHVSAVIKEDGSEDTTPRAMKMMSRTYENFVGKLHDMADYGVDYSERTHHVVVSDRGDVRIVKD